MAGGDLPDGSAWVGRAEAFGGAAETETLARLEATLGRAAPGEGEPMAPLRHWLWLFSPPSAPTAALGPDGHAPRGNLAPDWPLPRRMWAGSSLRWLGDLRAGQPLRRETRVESVTAKRGRTGVLGFVTLRHAWSGADGAVAIDEMQTVVYREAVAAEAAPPAPGGATTAPAGRSAQAGHGQSPAPAGDWHREIVPTETLLFRYSAVTFNTHRIHYDHPYATGVEGYPGLVVHGPLMATLMLDAFRDAHPGARVARFAFRALAPAFAGAPLHLGGTRLADGTSRLWVRAADGTEHVAGEAALA